jgi:hypothetical protein
VRKSVGKRQLIMNRNVKDVHEALKGREVKCEEGERWKKRKKNDEGEKKERRIEIGEGEENKLKKR